MHVRPSLRTLGREHLPKHWKENRWFKRSAPSSFRRARVRTIRHMENHRLANCIANGRLDDYEPIGLTRRDATHLWL